MTEIPISRPYFDDDESNRVVEVLRSGWVAQGPQVTAFEQAFAARCGAADAIAVSSGTTALHLALLAAGIGPGDEVLLPSFTWIATANSVLYCGATPVLCDVAPLTFNIDIEDAASRISDRTKVIMPVHQFGLPADMEAVTALANRHGLTVVGDAACAFGATYKETPAGSLAPLETFSFHPRKLLTTGEGGMITVQDTETAALLRSLRNHGGASLPHNEDPERFGVSLLADIDTLGFNYRLTDIQAAVGLAQLAKADRILTARREQARRYDDWLAECAWLLTPQTPAGCEHAYQSYVVMMAGQEGGVPGLDELPVLNATRNAILARLDQQGIATRQGTHAIHTLSLYADRLHCRPDALPGALLADRLSFSIPLFPGLTEEAQRQVVDALIAAYAALG